MQADGKAPDAAADAPGDRRQRLLRLGQGRPGEPAEEAFRRDGRLQPDRRRAEAGVRAEPEREVPGPGPGEAKRSASGACVAGSRPAVEYPASTGVPEASPST
ncbi:hypothetical protein Sdia_39150 [Streptomyces diastaticus subsp. diastaticus]|uniref:Uncharacterized protein n=1 Tax=Streptomyces diastaticus subsp. diastaticus TaxID=68040 RepID=A0ABQ1CS19_STRDI|nr:hypothetical protein Sdia_39150 [Streptomyces diastaticus subsp. diastaticus]GGU24736.1 hypothetical protein GCM10015534_29180 [Streptomyces diastaticus subsp. diastaticus]